MNSVILRNVEPDLMHRLRQQAEDDGTSLDETVQQLLRQALGLAPVERRFYDLDHHYGVWSREEAEAFASALEEERQIDPELWS